MEIMARDPGQKRGVSIDLSLPSSLRELIEKYGEDAITHAAKEQIATQAKSTLRYLLKKGESDKEIKDAMKYWKPFKRLDRTLVRHLDELTFEDV